MNSFDIVVIGGGPGGYVCAIRAAKLGLNVALVEKDKLGGTCLNRGCIPTKALLQSAKVVDLLKKSEGFGIKCDIKELSLPKIVQRSSEVVATLNRGVQALVAKNKITLFQGVARFQDKNTLLINDEQEVVARNIVVSTGAVAKMIPTVPEHLIKKGLVLTSKEAIALSVLPKKMLVIGSGAIGIEFASFYNSLGVNVSVAEIQEQILIMEDREVSNAALKILSKKGINFLLKTKLRHFSENNGQVSVEFVDSNENVVSDVFDIVMVAIGVRPNVDSLGLDKVGVLTNSTGNIVVDDFQQTNIAGIYAIGDVANPPFLAHKASVEGIAVADKIAGVLDADALPRNARCIPSCVYSSPQIASIGMTEEEVTLNKIAVKIGRAKFASNGKALASAEPDGFVKILFDDSTGEILGAHMIGHNVSELIPIFSIAIAGELTEQEMMAAVFPHPTMSEVIGEAVMDAFGMAIHA